MQMLFLVVYEVFHGILVRTGFQIRVAFGDIFGPIMGKHISQDL